MRKQFCGRFLWTAAAILLAVVFAFGGIIGAANAVAETITGTQTSVQAAMDYSEAYFTNEDDGSSGVSLTERIAKEHADFQSVNNGDRTSFVVESYDYSTGEGKKKGEQLAADYIIERLKTFGYGMDSSGDSNDEDFDDADNENSGSGSVNTSLDYYDSKAGDISANSESGTINALNALDDTEKRLSTPVASDASRSAQIILQPFSEVFSENTYSLFSKPQEYTIWSQNVILRLSNPATNKRVIIGCAIDNDYAEDSQGAIQTGSGVAILLSLARVLYGQELPYSVDLVFFGASKYNGQSLQVGSKHYCEKNSFGNILLMANIGRIGGETTYVYSDEVDSKLLDYGIGLGLFEKLPRSLPHFSADALGGPNNIGYAHYGMEGGHARFMERGIPVLNYFCGDYSGLTLKDSEGSGDILGNDTTVNMLEAYPDAYGKMMRVTVGLVSLALNSELEEVVTQSQADSFDYSVFLRRWIAYLIMAGLVLIGFVVLLFVCRKMYAAHPPTPPKPKPISVFGVEYDNVPRQ